MSEEIRTEESTATTAPKTSKKKSAESKTAAVPETQEAPATPDAPAAPEVTAEDAAAQQQPEGARVADTAAEPTAETTDEGESQADGCDGKDQDEDMESGFSGGDNPDAGEDLEGNLSIEELEARQATASETQKATYVVRENLRHNRTYYPKGGSIELTDREALQLVEDGLVWPHPDREANEDLPEELDRTYVVLSPLRHNRQIRKAGETVELDPRDATDLLAAGVIARPE